MRVRNSLQVVVAVCLWGAAISAQGEPIAVIGTGMMGGALGPRLAESGHQITYGTRDPSQHRVIELVKVTGPSASATTHAAAVADAEIVIIAVPWSALESVVKALGSRLDGKIVIDITNALSNAEDGLPQMAVDTSAGELVQSWLPEAKVVKAFNTVGFHVILEPDRAPGGVTVPVASNHDDARARVLALVNELGFAPFDAGPLRFARTLERLAGLNRVPHWADRRDQTFEYYFRPVAEPTPAEFPVLIRPRP
jgi:predicted dinucleotide-binding enzyme